MTRILDEKLLAEVSKEAALSPRLRRNRNFHEHEDAVQRLLNALEPGTYIRPHKHDGVSKFELFVVVQGAVGCVLFDSAGEVVSICRLEPQGNTRGIEIPGETFHTLVSLAPGSVVLEIKEGPYTPTKAKTFLAGFPEELDVLAGGEAARKAQAHLTYWEGLCGGRVERE